MPALDRKGLVALCQAALFYRVVGHAIQQRISPETLDLLLDAAMVDQSVNATRLSVTLRWWTGAVSLLIVVADKLTEGVPVAEILWGPLNIRTDLHAFWLDRLFPERIKDVALIWDQESNEGIVTVLFTNGHKVTRPEREVTGAEFIALCGLLHDLPEWTNGKDA